MKFALAPGRHRRRLRRRRARRRRRRRLCAPRVALRRRRKSPHMQLTSADAASRRAVSESRADIAPPPLPGERCGGMLSPRASAVPCWRSVDAHECSRAAGGRRARARARAQEPVGRRRPGGCRRRSAGGIPTRPTAPGRPCPATHPGRVIHVRGVPRLHAVRPPPPQSPPPTPLAPRRPAAGDAGVPRARRLNLGGGLGGAQRSSQKIGLARRRGLFRSQLRAAVSSGEAPLRMAPTRESSVGRRSVCHARPGGAAGGGGAPAHTRGAAERRRRRRRRRALRRRERRAGVAVPTATAAPRRRGGRAVTPGTGGGPRSAVRSSSNRRWSCAFAASSEVERRNSLLLRRHRRLERCDGTLRRRATAGDDATHHSSAFAAAVASAAVATKPESRAHASPECVRACASQTARHLDRRRLVGLRRRRPRRAPERSDLRRHPAAGSRAAPPPPSPSSRPFRGVRAACRARGR